MKHVSTTSRTLDGSRSKTNIKREENNIYWCATQIILLSTWEFWVRDVVDHRHPKLTSQKKKKKSARLILRYVPLYLFMKAFHAVWHGVKEVSSVHLNTLNMILVQTK